MTVFRIPLAPKAQQFLVVLGQTIYSVSLKYADVEDGGWFMNISDSDDNLLVAGLPLVTGNDILGQFEYLGIGAAGGVLYAYTDGDIAALPTYENLGTAGNLYYEVPDGA